MLTQKKINSLKVNVYKEKKEKPKKILGSEIVGDNLYWNCCLIASKNSGKTNLIWNILDNVASKKTTLIFFVGTIHQDDTYIKMLKHFREKDIKCVAYDSIFVNKINILNSFIDELKQLSLQKKEKAEKAGVEKDEFKPINVDDDEIVEYKKKDKKESPAYIMIFDDLAEQVKYVEPLSKIHRHLEVSVLTSSQYIHDFEKPFMVQQDIIILFPSFSLEKIKYIYENAALKLTLEQLTEMYKYATANPYNFLFIDRSRDQYRHNFDELLYFQ